MIRLSWTDAIPAEESECLVKHQGVSSPAPRAELRKGKASVRHLKAVHAQLKNVHASSNTKASRAEVLEVMIRSCWTKEVSFP